MAIGHVLSRAPKWVKSQYFYVFFLNDIICSQLCGEGGGGEGKGINDT
jgi:hypothetical protein